MIINAELKDSILKYIVESDSITFDLDIHEVSQRFGIDYHVLDVILEDFETKEFLECMRLIGGLYKITMKVPASDFYLRGGFYIIRSIPTHKTRYKISLSKRK
jgi:hypothetical protein